jgi:hypothetical protein
MKSRRTKNINTTFLIAGSRTGRRHTFFSSKKYAKRRSPPYATLTLLRLERAPQHGAKKHRPDKKTSVLRQFFA